MAFASVMNSQNELVSIITPIFNGAKYVNETANSIISQSYTNWEWLIVDDCSTDNSYELIQKLAIDDPRIRIFKNDVNSKTYASRNKALEHATGNFIAFVDADDVWHENKLEKQLNFMLENAYPFCYTNFKRFKLDPTEDGKIVNVPSKANFNTIISTNHIATSSVMINVAITGAFRMKNVYHDDFTLWLELLQRVPFASGLNETMMFYRLTPNSLSRNKFKSAMKVYDIFTNNLQLSYFKSRILFLRWAFYTTKKYLMPND